MSTFCLEHLRCIDQRLQETELTPEEDDLVKQHRLAAYEFAGRRFASLGPVPTTHQDTCAWQKQRQEAESDIKLSLRLLRLSVPGLEAAWQKYLMIEKLKMLRAEVLQKTSTLLAPQPAGGGAASSTTLSQAPGTAAPAPLLPPGWVPNLQSGGYKPPQGDERDNAVAVLHNADSAYQSDNLEENRKLEELKSILNRITPRNYQTLRDNWLYPVAVGISSAITLRGLVDQGKTKFATSRAHAATKVFDKALDKLDSSEMYATLCSDLQRVLPAFKDESCEDGGSEVTFRHLLNDKLQNEFQAGTAALPAVDGPKCTQEGDSTVVLYNDLGKLDTGWVSMTIKAHRRALGNISFIGCLFKKGMLTPKVIHSCITCLLREVHNPNPTDVDCLYMLLAKVGKTIDESPAGHQVMDAYIWRMSALAAKGAGLEHRHRCMIEELLELRANKWVDSRIRALWPPDTGLWSPDTRLWWISDGSEPWPGAGSPGAGMP